MDRDCNSNYKAEQVVPCEFIVPLPVAGEVKFFLPQNPSEKTNVLDPIQEALKVDQAILNACLRLKRILERLSNQKEADVIKAYIMMTEDQELRADICAQIDRGYSAGAAIENVMERYTSLLRKAELLEFRERSEDILAVCTGIADQLNGSFEVDYTVFKDRIVIAREVSAVQMLLLSEAEALGVAVERGGHSGHDAIFAKTEGLPYAVHAQLLLDRVKEGITVLFDPNSGAIVINPASDRMQPFIPIQNAEANSFFAANITGRRSLHAAVQNHLSRIGLIRTEALLMKRSKKPSEEEQKLIYQEILGAGIPAFARLVDVDEDKRIPWIESTAWHGKILRGKPVFDKNYDFYVTQIRALLGAGYIRPNGIMLPMVRSAEDFQDIKRTIISVAGDMGISRDLLMIGCMIECPEAVTCSSKLIQSADFISIGTNDLTRYLLGSSRSANLTILHSEIINIIRRIALDSHKHGITVGVCGDAASAPQNLKILVDSGIDYISVPPHLISILNDAIMHREGI